MSICGKYQLVSTNNFEEMLEAAGMGIDKRVLEGVPTFELAQDGDTFFMKVLTLGDTEEQLAFLERTGLGEEARRFKSAPTLEITKDGDTFTRDFVTGFYDYGKHKIKLNEERLEEFNLDKVLWSKVATMEGTRLVDTWTRTAEPATVKRITWIATETGLIEEHTCNGVTATDVYKRI